MGDLLELATKLGGAPLATVLIFLITVIVVTSKRGDWVWRREIEAKDITIAKLERDRDEWKELALEGRGVLRNAVDLAKRRSS